VPSGYHKERNFREGAWERGGGGGGGGVAAQVLKVGGGGGDKDRLVLWVVGERKLLQSVKDGGRRD